MSEAAIDEALTRPNLPSAFLLRATRSPERAALRAFGSDEHLTLGAWSARARSVAGGLSRLGIQPDERVALLLTMGVEFHVADMGALLLGAVPFSLYATSPVSQLREILENAEPRVLIVEASLADKARQLRAEYSGLKHLIVVEDNATQDGEISLAELEAMCPVDFDVHAVAASARSEDICTLVYTSGTTGPPKGVQFRHGAMLACLDSIRQRFDTSDRDRAISYLPMAHIAERVFGHYAAFVYGREVTSLGDPARLGEALRAVRPTRFFGVPRIYEKLLAALHRAIAESADRDRLRAALSTRLAQVRSEQSLLRAGEVPQHGDRDAAEVLRPLTQLTGLDRAHFLAVAGAPSSLGMLEELTAFGLPINEFYGSSETITVSCSPPERIRLGTAGTPLAGVRLRLAEDGEVLIAGPRRPYNVALIVLDRDGAAGFAGERGLGDGTFEQFTRHRKVLDAVAAAVESGNQRLARVEQIKRFVILDHDWPLGSKHLTPTAKLRRREIEMHYEDVIEALYV